MTSPQTTIFFGPSGAGKGTQARLLTEYLQADGTRKALYFGAGESARAFTKDSGSYLSKRTEEVLNTGGLLPSFIPIWLWSEFLIENYTGDEHLVFDGTRRLLEVSALDTALEFLNRVNPHIIVLNISKEVSFARLEARGRIDDKSREDIDSRLAWYESEVVPAINFFREKSQYTVHDIDGEPDVDVVQKEVRKALGI